MPSSTKKLAAIALTSLVVGVVLGVAVGERIEGINQLDQSRETGNALVRLMVDYGEGTIAVYSDTIHKENETLFEFTKLIAERNNVNFQYKEFTGLGILIEQIGQMKNGNDDKYWQYWVNNNYAAVGAASYLLKPGDIIEWKFVKQQGF